MLVHYYDTIDDFNEHNRWMQRETDFLLYDEPKHCPSCSEHLTVVNKEQLIKQLNLYDYIENRYEAEQPMQILELRICKKCNWFHIYRYLHDTEFYDCNQTLVVNSILKKFDISSKSAPIDELTKYLNSNIDDIYHIHHNKMEELVGAIFREHFDCEVIHCGKSFDRGIDLLMIEGDELIPIQVKRRMKPNSTEGVRVIREMLGVMLRDERKSAMVVTTANKFSTQARKEVNEVKDNLLINRFDLIDLNSLHGIMRNHFGGISIDPFEKLKKLCSVRK